MTFYVAYYRINPVMRVVNLFNFIGRRYNNDVIALLPFFYLWNFAATIPPISAMIVANAKSSP
jgi:hypothetical protein